MINVKYIYMEFAICNRREFASKECVLNTLQKLFTLKILLPDSRTGSLTNAKIVQHILTRPFFFQSLHCRGGFRCAGLVSSYGTKKVRKGSMLPSIFHFCLTTRSIAFKCQCTRCFPFRECNGVGARQIPLF